MVIKEKKITDIRVDVPEGISKDWRIEKFTISEADAKFYNMRATFSYGGGRRIIRSGEYTRLVKDHTVIMSDTPAEIRDHLEFVKIARLGKHILINGLGLGWALEAILDAPKIKTITVIEKSKDVINLVKQHYYDKCPKDKYLIIVNTDALEFKPHKGQRYNAVWHDIWENICSDNLNEMKTLYRKYSRYCDWQGSWCRYECEQAAKR